MKKTLGYAAIAALVMACGTGDNKQTATKTEVLSENILSAEEKAAGWQLLFDGKSVDGWKGFNKDSFPKGWLVDSGCLKALGTAHGDTGGDIVYTTEKFENFELVWNWKIDKGGNSGVFYHVVEDTQYAAPYHTGPEYQLIDEANFPEKLENWQTTAADYAMYEPPATKKSKAFGEWNLSRIVFTKEKAEYWLNGEMTVSFVPWSSDWTKKRNSGKWDSFPDYGKANTGLIALQDHGSAVWFKNIKIRKL
ncbi:MAG: DUF1080 domain-containing protein [Bacteroidetes bacterium]|nr:MAG: DUF1080 domain-containing protein [Bacteroidota bacterium]